MSTPRTGDYMFVSAGPDKNRVGRIVRYDVSTPKKPVPVLALLPSGRRKAREVTVPFKDLVLLYRTWSRASRALPDEDTMLRLYAEGVTADDVAAMYGVRHTAVWKCRQRMGIPGGYQSHLYPSRELPQSATYRQLITPALSPERGDTMNVGCHVVVTSGPYVDRPGKLVGWDLVDERLAPVLDLLPMRRLKGRRVTLTQYEVRVILRPWPGAVVTEPTQDTLRRLINLGFTAEDISTRYNMPVDKVRVRIRRVRGVAAPAVRRYLHVFPFVSEVRAADKRGREYRYLSYVAGAARGTVGENPGTVKNLKVSFNWLRNLHRAKLAVTYSPTTGFSTRPAKPTDAVKRYRIEGMGQVDVRFAA